MQQHRSAIFISKYMYLELVVPLQSADKLVHPWIIYWEKINTNQMTTNKRYILSVEDYQITNVKAGDEVQ